LKPFNHECKKVVGVGCSYNIGPPAKFLKTCSKNSINYKKVLPP